MYVSIEKINKNKKNLTFIVIPFVNIEEEDCWDKWWSIKEFNEDSWEYCFELKFSCWKDVFILK